MVSKCIPIITTQASACIRPNGFKKPKMSWKRKIFILLMVIVPLINFGVFYVAVNLSSILMAFQVLENNKLVYSTLNFKLIYDSLLLPDSIIQQSLGNTLKTFGVNLLITMPLTIAIAYFLYKKVLFNGFFKVMFFLPAIISAVVLTMLFVRFTGRDGFLSKVFKVILQLDEYPLLLNDSRYAMTTVLLYSIWTGFSVNLVLFNGAFNRVPPDVLEAAKIDGIGMFKELVLIILPMIWPTLTTIILFNFVGIFTASGPILLLTMGAHETYTLSYYIFKQVYDISGGMPNYASAVGLFFTVIALPIVFGVKFVLDRLNANIEY